MVEDQRPTLVKHRQNGVAELKFGLRQDHDAQGSCFEAQLPGEQVVVSTW